MIYNTHRQATVKAGIGALLAGHCGARLVSVDQSCFEPPARGLLITDYEHGMRIAGQRDAACLPGLKIILVTGRTREWEIRNAIDQRIDAILTHDCDADELAHTIRHLQAGHSYLSASIADRACAAMQREKLTGREHQVLHCLGQGFCNKLIARALGIAEVTVKIHLGNLMIKLGATTRTQAVVTANALGLIEFDAE